MIKTPLLAIAWSMINAHRISAIILALSIPSMLLIKLLFIDYLPQVGSDGYIEFYIMPLVCFTLLMVMFFNFAELNNSFGVSGFPKYTFVHPMTSFQLAIIPIGLGILMTYLYYIGWMVFVVEYQFAAYQLLIVFCCVSGGVSWVQVMSWRYNTAPLTSVALMLVITASIFVVFVSSWDVDNLKPLINKNLAYVGLILLPTSGILLAINSVARCRTNENQKKSHYLSNVGFIGFNLPKNYHSISHALFRYEWRVFGWMLPMASIFLIPLLIFIANKKGVSTAFIDGSALISLTLIILSWSMPAEMSKSDLTRVSEKSSRLSSFIASLPVSNFELAMAKIKLTMRSIGLFHLVILLTINIILILLDDKILMNPWTLLESHFGLIEGGVILLGINLMYPIIAWILGGNTLAWCLKGERYFIARRIVITLIGLLFIGFIGFRFYTPESFRSLLIDYAPLISGLIFVAIAIFFYRAIKKFSSIESLASIKSVIIIAVSLLAFELYIFSALELINFRYPHRALILLDLMLLGVLPFLTSPLSIAKSRAC